MKHCVRNYEYTQKQWHIFFRFPNIIYYIQIKFVEGIVFKCFNLIVKYIEDFKYRTMTISNYFQCTFKINTVKLKMGRT